MSPSVSHVELVASERPSSPRPGVAPAPAAGTGAPDLARAELAAEDFLDALGVSLESEHLRATPGRMARAWAEMLTPRLSPRAVGVVIIAEHSCMTLRGARATGSSTVTSTLLGRFREDPRCRQEFLALSGITAA